MFFKGILLGLSVAAPIGPINLLCIQRTLSRGRLHGFVSGLGAATADTLYGLIAALGLTAVSALLLRQQVWLQLLGGLFLLGVGLKTALTAPVDRAAAPTVGSGLARAYCSVLLLTLANPATILLFFAVFSALGLGGAAGGTGGAVLLVLGVFTGSAVWWLFLSLAAGLLRGHLTDGRMRAVNLIAGGCILALAAWALWPLLRAKLL